MPPIRTPQLLSLVSVDKDSLAVVYNYVNEICLIIDSRSWKEYISGTHYSKKILANTLTPQAQQHFRGGHVIYQQGWTTPHASGSHSVHAAASLQRSVTRLIGCPSACSKCPGWRSVQLHPAQRTNWSRVPLMASINASKKSSQLLRKFVN